MKFDKLLSATIFVAASHDEYVTKIVEISINLQMDAKKYKWPEYHIDCTDWDDKKVTYCLTAWEKVLDK